MTYNNRVPHAPCIIHVYIWSASSLLLNTYCGALPQYVYMYVWERGRESDQWQFSLDYETV